MKGLEARQFVDGWEPVPVGRFVECYRSSQGRTKPMGCGLAAVYKNFTGNRCCGACEKCAEAMGVFADTPEPSQLETNLADAVALLRRTPNALDRAGEFQLSDDVRTYLARIDVKGTP